MKKIISKNGHGEIVEKKSRFISELVHVNSSEEAMNVVAEIKKKHFDARHNCYAYVCENRQDILMMGSPAVQPVSLC